MKATRVGFYFSIIGIPTYFEGDFYLKPAGRLHEGEHHERRPSWPRVLLKAALEPSLGCPVNI